MGVATAWETGGRIPEGFHKLEGNLLCLMETSLGSIAPTRRVQAIDLFYEHLRELLAGLECLDLIPGDYDHPNAPRRR
jgi:hypothetical protein